MQKNNSDHSNVGTLFSFSYPKNISEGSIVKTRVSNRKKRSYENGEDLQHTSSESSSKTFLMKSENGDQCSFKSTSGTGLNYLSGLYEFECSIFNLSVYSIEKEYGSEGKINKSDAFLIQNKIMKCFSGSTVKLLDARKNIALVETSCIVPFPIDTLVKILKLGIMKKIHNSPSNFRTPFKSRSFRTKNSILEGIAFSANINGLGLELRRLSLNLSSGYKETDYNVKGQLRIGIQFLLRESAFDEVEVVTNMEQNEPLSLFKFPRVNDISRRKESFGKFYFIFPDAMHLLVEEPKVTFHLLNNSLKDTYEIFGYAVHQDRKSSFKSRSLRSNMSQNKQLHLLQQPRSPFLGEKQSQSGLSDFFVANFKSKMKQILNSTEERMNLKSFNDLIKRMKDDKEHLHELRHHWESSGYIHPNAFTHLFVEPIFHTNKIYNKSIVPLSVLRSIFERNGLKLPMLKLSYEFRGVFHTEPTTAASYEQNADDDTLAHYRLETTYSVARDKKSAYENDDHLNLFSMLTGSFSFIDKLNTLEENCLTCELLYKIMLSLGMKSDEEWEENENSRYLVLMDKPAIIPHFPMTNISPVVKTDFNESEKIFHKPQIFEVHVDLLIMSRSRYQQLKRSNDSLLSNSEWRNPMSKFVLGIPESFLSQSRLLKKSNNSSEVIHDVKEVIFAILYNIHNNRRHGNSLQDKKLIFNWNRESEMDSRFIDNGADYNDKDDNVMDDRNETDNESGETNEDKDETGDSNEIDIETGDSSEDDDDEAGNSSEDDDETGDSSEDDDETDDGEEQTENKSLADDINTNVEEKLQDEHFLLVRDYNDLIDQTHKSEDLQEENVSFNDNREERDILNRAGEKSLPKEHVFLVRNRNNQDNKGHEYEYSPKRSISVGDDHKKLNNGKIAITVRNRFGGSLRKSIPRKHIFLARNHTNKIYETEGSQEKKLFHNDDQEKIVSNISNFSPSNLDLLGLLQKIAELFEFGSTSLFKQGEKGVKSAKNESSLNEFADVVYPRLGEETDVDEETHIRNISHKTESLVHSAKGRLKPHIDGNKELTRPSKKRATLEHHVTPRTDDRPEIMVIKYIKVERKNSSLPADVDENENEISHRDLRLRSKRSLLQNIGRKRKFSETYIRVRRNGSEILYRNKRYLPENNWCPLKPMVRHGDVDCTIWTAKKECVVKCHDGYGYGDKKKEQKFFCKRKVNRWNPPMDACEKDSSEKPTKPSSAKPTLAKPPPTKPMPQKGSGQRDPEYQPDYTDDYDEYRSGAKKHRDSEYQPDYDEDYDDDDVPVTKKQRDSEYQPDYDYDYDDDAPVTQKRHGSHHQTEYDDNDDEDAPVTKKQRDPEYQPDYDDDYDD